MSTLVLNKDGNPVSMLPLSIISWQESIKHMVLEKATVLDWYDDWVVRSARWETRVPAVIMLNEYMKPKTFIRFSKANIFLRDGFKCAYCECAVSSRSATIDHILPVSMGGKTTFENCITSCGPCNSRKGSDHRIKPKKTPSKPNYFQLVDQRRKMGFELTHPSWALYLGIDY
jgi:5-methylcytosine-specific restriction endonuclease McrA